MNKTNPNQTMNKEEAIRQLVMMAAREGDANNLEAIKFAVEYMKSGEGIDISVASIANMQRRICEYERFVGDATIMFHIDANHKCMENDMWECNSLLIDIQKLLNEHGQRRTDLAKDKRGEDNHRDTGETRNGNGSNGNGRLVLFLKSIGRLFGGK